MKKKRLRETLTWWVIYDGFAHFSSFSNNLMQNMIVLDIRQSILIISHRQLQTK